MTNDQRCPTARRRLRRQVNGCLIALATAHHYLRHRTLDMYPYAAYGPTYDSPYEFAEAHEFMKAFINPERYS